MNEFRSKPKDFILLGDSRSDSLKKEYFNEIGINNFYNFSYGGGTLYEAIDTFWFATKQIKLKRVVVGIPFNIFNEYNSLNLTSEAKEMLGNHLIYYMNSFVLKVSLLNILDKFQKVNIEEPEMDKEHFWKIQLGEVTKTFYLKYRYPKSLVKKLQEVSDYCKINNIKFQFYIPPTHIDLQKKISKYKLDEEYINYKKDLSNFGEVIDFDYFNEVTLNKNNFNDPYHFNQNIAKKIVKEVINNTQYFSKRY